MLSAAPPKLTTLQDPSGKDNEVSAIEGGDAKSEVRLSSQPGMLHSLFHSFAITKIYCVT
jgi:hypothetical protein